jgi:elongation factor Ts
MGGKIGVLVEINCETDFVARGEPFQEFCKNVCLQVCSSAPRWVRREEASPEEIQAEKAIYEVQAKESGKPENVQQKIVEGKLNKWLKENSLLDQEFVKNPDVTIEELMKELSGKVGEKIDIRRFARFQLGEALDATKPEEAGEE